MDLDKAVDQILDGYAAVEPPEGAVERWLRRGRAPLPARRFWGLAAPAWAAIAALLVVLLGASWYVERRELLRARAKLAQERAAIVALPAASAPPLTDREKQLIQLMEKDPSALAAIGMDDADQPHSKSKPAARHPKGKNQ
ncbi:MAG TPA: hypothetical protein VN709_04245 [Terriglobales bacterium]|nr:hypothetical protein [Terriglobales bacterium]